MSSQADSPRSKAVFLAKLSEQSERHEEMVNYMKEVAQMGVELTVEERNLLSVAYKNVIGTRRAAWRVVNSIEQQQKDEKRHNLVAEYKKKIEQELSEICNDIINILDKYLIPACNSDESSVFHLKLKADYYRYLAEFSSGDSKKEAASNAEKAYSEAMKHAEDIPITNPIRLGLVLNYTVFNYEILNAHIEACNMAKETFQKAVEELDTLSEETYKDSTLILQLLKDNLSLWTSEEEQEDEGDSTTIEEA
eukprot:CAMPEP_0117445026 /NCGR_PEP_ID=MMETSP0759-20121206/5566_1 /TAXON_ID=63605 /ORGANISM="Percolomonas cosmopolitus, Strain WS" /LENGTH=250 /DNA_ID=CAMNT_0005237155 /DNA_START=330 /DNA_END=1082 /DNA_ORIENTATION=+